MNSNNDSIISIRKSIVDGDKFVVKGTDGWSLITNDEQFAREEARKHTRNYGENRITY